MLRIKNLSVYLAVGSPPVAIGGPTARGFDREK